MLTEMGVVCTRLHPREVVGGSGNYIPKRIKQNDFATIWIRYQRRKTRELPERVFKKFMLVVSLWIRIALGLGTQVFIIGLTGNHWDGTQFEQLVQDGNLHDAKHRICHFGWKFDNTSHLPSSVCHRTLTSDKVPSHDCKCDVSFQQRNGKYWNSEPSLTNAVAGMKW